MAKKKAGSTVTMVTGHNGFIGSHVVIELLKTTDHFVVGLDCNTYAANPAYLEAFFEKHPEYLERFDEFGANIAHEPIMDYVMRTAKPKHIIHLAAESHVCNSLKGPRLFYEVNTMGTFNLVDSYLKHCHQLGGRFVYVSTDEVFGELDGDPGNRFSEHSTRVPRSPYAASKAAGELVVEAAQHSYGLRAIITNCSNNYGKNQFEEKLIPKAVGHLLRGEPVTVYGRGNQVRDWLHVEDHARGIVSALFGGHVGERYLFGGECETTNLELIQAIEGIVKNMVPGLKIKKRQHTGDRPTDDFRYAIDCSKAKNELGWRPSGQLARLEETVAHYIEQHLPGHFAPGYLDALAEAFEPKAETDDLHERIRYENEMGCSADDEPYFAPEPHEVHFDDQGFAKTFNEQGTDVQEQALEQGFNP